MAQARLAERDQRRVDRLVGAAFGPERQAADGVATSRKRASW